MTVQKYWKTELSWMKAYIFVIWVLDSTHQALVMKYLYILFIRHFGDFQFLDTIPR